MVGRAETGETSKRSAALGGGAFEDERDPAGWQQHFKQPDSGSTVVECSRRRQ